MELPIVTFPSYVEELSGNFARLFEQERQLNQFKRLMTAFPMAERCTVAHMNGLFTSRTDQSNLNRFITSSNWKIDEMNSIKVEMINSIEGDGAVIIDDYIVEKYGKEIHGVGWHYDHTNGRKVWGIQVADCVLAGRGIHPLLSTVYLKRGSRWLEDEDDFRSKIDIQKEHLTRLVEMGLLFSYVAMDIWYFCRELTDHIENLGKDWIAQCKSNRKVWYHGKWVSLLTFAQEIIRKVELRVVNIGDERYLMKAFTLNMRGMGRVRVLVSLNKHNNFHFYVSNRLDWNEVTMARKYSPRWDIEVWHREGRGNYGLEDCQLRSGEAVSKYLTLSSLAANLLEIASMLSPVYAHLTNQGWTPEMKHRWVTTELVGQLISSAGGIRDKEVRRIVEGILCPYKSTLRSRKAS